MRSVLASFLVLCLSVVGAFAQTLPQLTGRVVDAAEILSPETETFLSELSEDYEKATGNQVVVATVPSLEGYDIRQFGVELGQAWALGREGENSILLLVAPNEGKAAIETGYSVESVLTDAIAKLIIEGSILPRFRQGDFDDGVVRGTQDIIALLGNPEAMARQTRGPFNPGDSVVAFISIVVVAIVLIIALTEKFGRPLPPPGRRRFDGFSDGGGGWDLW